MIPIIIITIFALCIILFFVFYTDSNNVETSQESYTDIRDKFIITTDMDGNISKYNVNNFVNPINNDINNLSTRISNLENASGNTVDLTSIQNRLNELERLINYTTGLKLYDNLSNKIVTLTPYDISILTSKLSTINKLNDANIVTLNSKSTTLNNLTNTHLEFLNGTRKFRITNKGARFVDQTAVYWLTANSNANTVFRSDPDTIVVGGGDFNISII